MSEKIAFQVVNKLEDGSFRVASFSEDGNLLVTGFICCITKDCNSCKYEEWLDAENERHEAEWEEGLKELEAANPPGIREDSLDNYPAGYFGEYEP